MLIDAIEGDENIEDDQRWGDVSEPDVREEKEVVGSVVEVVEVVVVVVVAVVVV